MTAFANSGVLLHLPTKKGCSALVQVENGGFFIWSVMVFSSRAWTEWIILASLQKEQRQVGWRINIKFCNTSFFIYSRTDTWTLILYSVPSLDMTPILCSPLTLWQRIWEKLTNKDLSLHFNRAQACRIERLNLWGVKGEVGSVFHIHLPLLARRNSPSPTLRQHR